MADDAFLRFGVTWSWEGLRDSVEFFLQIARESSGLFSTQRLI